MPLSGAPINKGTNQLPKPPIITGYHVEGARGEHVGDPRGHTWFKHTVKHGDTNLRTKYTEMQIMPKKT